jgi:hypothetical protein
MEANAISMFQSTIKYSGDVIFIKPFCDFFGISYQNQQRFISNDHILKRSSTKKSSMFIFGDERERLALPKKSFIRWIQLINPQIVQVTLREKLIVYQEMIYDFLFSSVEQIEQVRTDFKRLKKLRSLYGKVGSEIQNVNNKITGFLENQLSQTEIPFPEQKKLPQADIP